MANETTKNNFEIRKVLGLSTMHITQKTTHRLARDPEDNNLGLTIYPFEYGWWVFIGNVSFKEDKIYYDNEPITSLPSDLIDCIKIGLENDCQWLQFDCDAEEYDNLPIYYDLD